MIPVTKFNSKTPKPPADCANSKNSAERRAGESASTDASRTSSLAGFEGSCLSVRRRNLLSNLF